MTVSDSYGPGENKQITFEGLGEAGTFVEVEVSSPAWVRFYPTLQLLQNDALRESDTDPQPGSGVLLEVLTKQVNQKLTITPGSLYFNNDTLPEQKLYAAVKNQLDEIAAISVTVYTYGQINCDAVVGGLF